MDALQSIQAAWLVITACLSVIMGIDVIFGWLKRPRADKGLEPKQYSVGKTITSTTPKQKFQLVTIHYPMTDEQEAREEKIKTNDAKGIDTPIEDII